MHFEVDVTLDRPIDEDLSRFLESVRRSANRVVRFRGDDLMTTVTVEVAGMCEADAIKGAAAEMARIFPGRRDARFGVPREV